MANSKFEMDVIEYAQKFARKRFATAINRDDLIADTVRLAWQFARSAGPTATAGTCIRYAMTRAVSARMLGMTVRSIDHPRNREDCPRERLDVGDLWDLFRERDDPAVIVQVRVDFAAWLASLPPKKATAVRLLAIGERPTDVAKAMNVSDAWVSVLKKELLANWREFTE